jgi:hypothetical protein
MLIKDQKFVPSKWSITLEVSEHIYQERSDSLARQVKFAIDNCLPIQGSWQSEFWQENISVEHPLYLVHVAHCNFSNS